MQGLLFFTIGSTALRIQTIASTAPPFLSELNGTQVDSFTLNTSQMQNAIQTYELQPEQRFDRVVMTFNGSSQNFREVEIFAHQPDLAFNEASFTLNENIDGSGTPHIVGSVSAQTNENVTYSFMNGTLADGDFRIDANSGQITYVGGPLDYEAITQVNLAPDATITTNITDWAQLNNTTETAIAAMVDGVKSTSGQLNYAVHPYNADGDNINFSLDRVYDNGSFIFYNRVGGLCGCRPH